MIGYEIEMEGLEEQLEAFKNFEELANRELTIAMTKSVIVVESDAKFFAPVDRGTLRASIHHEVRELGDMDLVGRIGPSLSEELYPQVMEFGREAGARMPPFEPIYDWVWRVIRPKLGGEPSEKALGKITQAVRISIARKGIKGREYMRKGFEKNIDKIKEFFGEALERITQGLSNGRQ